MRSFHVPHDRVTVDTGEFTFTQQSCKDECDINNILKQYKRTGILTHVNPAQPEYIDLPSDVELQTSMNVVNAAANAFADMPSSVRDMFDNDPVKFLAGIHDPSKRKELEAAGLIRARDALDVAQATLAQSEGS